MPRLAKGVITQSMSNHSKVDQSRKRQHATVEKVSRLKDGEVASRRRWYSKLEGTGGKHELLDYSNTTGPIFRQWPVLVLRQRVRKEHGGKKRLTPKSWPS